MKKILLTLALLFAPTLAWGQCNGVFTANQVCGSTSGGPPGPTNFSAFPAGPPTGTAGGDLTGTYPNPSLVAGVDKNVLNSQVANYSIATPDCGRTVQAGTGSTGYFIVTLPAVSGFAATCKVTVTNGDTVRAKGLSGFPINVAGYLFPLQTVVVEIVNGVWIASNPPGLWTPTAATTFFVDNVNGNDANDCLASGTGNACLTSAVVMTRISARINNVNGLTFQYANNVGSPYTVQFSALSYTGPGSITIDGNSSTMTLASAPGGCSICIGLAGTSQFGVAGKWNIRGFTITGNAAGIFGILCASTTQCNMLDGMVFGTLTTTGSDYACTQASRCTCVNNFTVSGTAVLNVLDSSDFSVMKCQNITITISAALTISGATVSVHGGGMVDIVGVTYTVSGSATGQRYKADLLGFIDSGACNSIAGSTAGSPTAGTLGTSGGFCN